jgi:ergothioneine biosynthesis protein EgtB
MSGEGIAARSAGRSDLEHALRDAYQRSIAVLADLAPDQWRVPYHAGINPPLWEYAHVAWFSEWWVLREAHWTADDELVSRRASMLPGADRWFDSSRVAHADRWTLDLPPLDEIRDYARAVHDGVLAKLAGADGDLYAFRLALFHEDMHGEALTYMRQTLDYAAPWPLRMPKLRVAAGDVEIAEDAFALGSPRDQGFVFDNEKWEHRSRLERYRIARHCVSNAEFVDFVEAGGYREPRWWSDEGLGWLRETRIDHPQRWRRGRDGFEQRWFGSWQPLAPDAPVCHVNAYEAEAYCRSTGRGRCGNGRPTPSPPIPASHLTAIATTRSRGSGRTGACAAGRSRQSRASRTRGIATSTCRIATTSSRAFAPAAAWGRHDITRLRSFHHRRWPGRAAARARCGEGRAPRRAGRAQAPRWIVRQFRLHTHESRIRVGTCGAPRAPRRRLRSAH